LEQENKIYSPIHRLVYDQFQIDVKRDDLIDPYISGNKYRKLKYILKTANALGKDHLVTFGGAYSNHVLATAAAAARFGYRSTAFIRGEEVHNHMLFLCHMFGMKCIFISRECYRDKQKLFDAYFSKDPQTFMIDEGGAGEEAVKGCAEIIDEITEPYDYLFCAAGTGTTGAGLLRGINQKALPTALHIIPVLKDNEFIRGQISRYEPNTDCLHFHTDYHFGGYAKTTPHLLDFIQDFTQKTGLLTDHVYTGKVFYALYDLLQKQIIPSDARILVLHTGGLLGLLGAEQKFRNETAL